MGAGLDDIAEAAIGLFMALSDAAVVVDVLEDRDDVRVIAVNPATAAGFFGTEPAALVGRLGSELYPPQELADVVRRARQALAAGEPQSYEAVRERPQGRRVVTATVIPVGPSRVVSHGRDISDHVEALRKLDDLEGLADIGSWQWNLADRSLTWSAHYRRILGVDDDEEPATLDRILDRMHPDDRDRVMERVRAASSGAHEGRPITYRIVRPDGEERVVEGRGHVVTDVAGQPIRMFGTVQDVTEAHRAAADRLRLERALAGQRQALELNDNVVQGLSAAWLAFELGQTDEGIALVQRTTRDAQQLVHSLLREAAMDEALAPGDLAREAPANVDHPDPA